MVRATLTSRARAGRLTPKMYQIGVSMQARLVSVEWSPVCGPETNGLASRVGRAPS